MFLMLTSRPENFTTLTGTGFAEHELAIRACDGDYLTTYKLTSNAQWHGVATMACSSIPSSIMQ